MNKKMSVFLTVIMISATVGCTDYKALYEQSQKDLEEANTKIESLSSELEALKSEAEAPEEVSLEDYDYKTDPNTLAINITDENIDEYFDLIVVKSNKNDTYTVYTHSLMYDKGYVEVGYYYTNCKFYGCSYEFDGKIYEGDSNQISLGSDRICSMPVCHGFSDAATAQKYADKGIKAYIKMDYPDATVYYQKKEDVKFGYSMEDGKRIVNGNEIRSDDYYADNPF